MLEWLLEIYASLRLTIVNQKLKLDWSARVEQQTAGATGVAWASPINRKNAEHYTRHGAIAIANNDWQTARKAFTRAVVNADLGGVTPSTRAVLSYEYGRSLGATCFFDDATFYLNQAYDLDKQTGGPL